MNKDLDRVMATAVMGRELKPYNNYYYGGKWHVTPYKTDGWYEKNDVCCDADDWQPSQFIEQAMECWETFHTKHKPKRFRLNTYTDDSGSIAEIWIGAKLYCRGPLCQSGLAEAICLALKEAVGGQKMTASS